MCFLFSPADAYANGIPVIFAVTVFHIIIINSFVIAFEFSLLRKFSKKGIFIGYVIFANLASLFLAYALTDTTIASYLDSQWFGLKGKGKIEKRVFLAGVAVFICLTIIIEWPFLHLAQKTGKGWFQSLKYSALINLITNIPIAIFYLINNLYYEDYD